MADGDLACAIKLKLACGLRADVAAEGCGY